MQDTKERIDNRDKAQFPGKKPEQSSADAACGVSQWGADPKNKGQEKAATVGDAAKDLAVSVADKSKDLAVAVAHSAGEMASDFGHKTMEGASAVAHKVADMASQAGHKAEQATGAVGGGMQSLAGTMRTKGPQGGMMGAASGAVAQTLDTTGRYLKEEGLKGIGEDVSNLIRRHPLQAVLLGIGVGYLLARSTTRS